MNRLEDLYSHWVFLIFLNRFGLRLWNRENCLCSILNSISLTFHCDLHYILYQHCQKKNTYFSLLFEKHWSIMKCYVCYSHCQACTYFCFLVPLKIYISSENILGVSGLLRKKKKVDIACKCFKTLLLCLQAVEKGVFGSVLWRRCASNTLWSVMVSQTALTWWMKRTAVRTYTVRLSHEVLVAFWGSWGAN